MSYIFEGNLCGYICPDCPEPIFPATVRLYRPSEEVEQTGAEKTGIIAANPKDTFSLLSSEEVEEKANALLAEAETKDNGDFDFELGEDESYDGGPFQIDVQMETVPGKEATEDQEPRQFTITTLQPQWRQREEGQVGVWDYCIPQRFWCAVRSAFNAWVICGRVVDCETEEPVSGVEVSAFDADWTQDDELGSGTTDGNGRFRIDYTRRDFEKTPFSPQIDVELVGGPDLFFKVSSGGTVLLEEPRSRGRDPDRENAGQCFCVELCVDEPRTEDPPLFSHVGDFHIVSDIDSTTGRTAHAVFGHGGPDFGFTGNLKLKGFCPQVAPAAPSKNLRYRFLYVHPDDPTTEVPLTGAAVFPVKVGVKEIMWDIDGDGVTESTFQDIIVAPPSYSPPSIPPTSPPPLVINPDSNGWVNVDPDPAVWGDAFGMSGALLGFRSAQAVSGGNATEPADEAGDPPSNPKDGKVLKLIFEAAPVGGGPPIRRDELKKLHVNNWQEVSLLDLKQFREGSSGSCTPLTNDLDIFYTADHELMRDWEITISTAASGVSPSLPGGSGPRGGHGQKHINISSWPTCSYRVRLRTRRKLTNGEDDDDWDSRLLTFCK